MTTVAGGGLYPGPFHGRNHRAVAARIRRHHQHGDPHFRLRLPHPDTDALQPFPAATGGREAWPSLTWSWSASSTVCPNLRPHSTGCPITVVHAWSYCRTHPVTGFLFTGMPDGIPSHEDTGQVFAFTEAAPGISFEEMRDKQQRLAAIVAGNPNVAAFMSSVGSGGASGSVNAGRMNIRLKPREERSLSSDEIIRELRPRVATVPGIRMFLQNPPTIRIGGRLTKSQYQYTLQSPDTAVLMPAPRNWKRRCGAFPSFRT